MAGLEPGLAPLEALSRLPGVEGMTLFAQALNARSSRANTRSPLLGAVEAYANFVQAAGGSQAGLIKRIGLSTRAADGVVADTIGARRKLYEGASEMLGYACETALYVQAIRPVPGSPTTIEGMDMVGSIGLRARMTNVTVVVGLFANDQRTYTPLDHENGSGRTMLEEFCTQPLPIATEESQAGVSRTALEFRTGTPTSVDFIFGQRWSPQAHPMLLPEREYYTSATITRPSRRLIFDVYMHRSMASLCVPSAAPFLRNPMFAGGPAQRWGDRLPGRVPIEHLGVGLGNVASSSWHSHLRLIRRGFELSGWNPDEFVGFRCDVPYPTWAAAYYMNFDFRSEEGRAAEMGP